MSTPRPRPDIGSAGQSERPAIWINGRQRPSFDLRAYGAYSVIATRAALGPALQRGAAHTSHLQSRIEAGDWHIDTARLGRAARYLPTRPGIAASISGAASILSAASLVVSPPPPEPESLAAYDALWRARKPASKDRLRGVDLDEVRADPELRALRDNQPLRPQRLVRHIAIARDATSQEAYAIAETPSLAFAEPPPAALPIAAAVADPDVTQAPPEEDTVIAIRNLILDDLAPSPGISAPKAPDERPLAAASAQPLGAAPAKSTRKPLPAWTKPVLRQLHRGTATTLAWGLITVCMPIGLVKAGIAHLEGRDLRDLVEEP